MSNKIHQPLVSVIVPTYNSEVFLDACLASISRQRYKNIEVIVVDNNSTDQTKKIAKKYTKNIYNKGPERSAQVNYGVRIAKGKFIYKVDSDFVLDKDVISQCVDEANKGYEAIVVHNSPDTKVSWIAKIRKFEVDMYKYDITHSSARFVRKDIYQRVGGFDESITAGEDYDFQNKLNRIDTKTGFINAEALHLGEPTHFWQHMKKYFKYGADFVNYKAANDSESKAQLSFFRSVYLRNWKIFIMHPIYACGFMGYNICKFTAGGFGYMLGKVNSRRNI